MSDFAFVIALIATAIWTNLLLFRGGFWRLTPEHLPPKPQSGATTPCPDVVAVVPARDEAETIAAAIRSLLAQNYAGRLLVVLVDDHSSDGTAAIARQAATEAGAAERLHIVTARPLPADWTGKLWAMSEGLAAADHLAPEARYVLLTDADIVHAPDNLAGLVARGEREGLDLASLMVRLRTTSWAERAFVPAFVYFFAMLYPFSWVARRDRATAAAAGGCMLARRSTLGRIGGVQAIRGQLIDDCALAAAIKSSYGPNGAYGTLWLGLADRTESLRRYDRSRDVWAMIARTAFTQLRFSPVLLAATMAGMLLTFVAPPILAFTANGAAAALGAAAWLAMAATYMPILRTYRRSLAWAPFLPVIALFYLGATLDSARLHWLGRGGRWKGRDQAQLATRDRA